MTPKRILIVDDSMELARLLRDALELLPNAPIVRTAPTAEEAVLDLIKQPMDLLVCDVRLPGLSGIELVRKVRVQSKNKKLKVLMISGWNEPGLEESALAAGADGFMRKPLNVGEFLDWVTDILGEPSAVVPPAEPPVVAHVPMVEKPMQPSPTLANLLANLRQDLGAQAAALLDERGKVVIAAGEMPNGGFENEWSPALLAAASAAARVSLALKADPPASALAFRGQTLDLLLAPLPGHCLVLFFAASRSAVRLPIAVEAAMQARPEFVTLLAGLGQAPAPTPHAVEVLAATPPPAPVAEEPINEVEAAELEALLGPARQAIAGQDVDAFWEQALEPSSGEVSRPDMLTYDQARRLGLAPTEDDDNQGVVAI